MTTNGPSVLKHWFCTGCCHKRKNTSRKNCFPWSYESLLNHWGGENVGRLTRHFFPVSLLSARVWKESKIANIFFSCVDLKTMSERLKNRYYVSKKLFMADLQRVFTNCKEYNPPESEYYKCANILEKFFFSKIKEAGLIDKWYFFPLLLRNSSNSVPKAWFSFTKNWT